MTKQVPVKEFSTVMGILFTLTVLGASAVTPDDVSPMDHAPALWAGLIPGPYRVGYRRLDTAGGVVHAWYPTSARGSRLRFRDYLGDDAHRLESFLAQAGVDPATTGSLFASLLYAVRSPRPLERAFPLVLIAQGNGQDVADQVVLCEYLASRGFVVATTPSPMLHTPLEREDQVGALADTQASELAAAISAVSIVLRVDSQHLGVVGHSFGARAALLLAMRDPRIRAIVSLDGGIGTATAVEPFRRAPSFRSAAPLPPLLHFYEELDAFMTPDFALLRSLHTAELILEPTEGMHHAHFTTYGFAAAVFPDLAAVTHATSATARGAVAVEERTATFLRRCLR
jgi:dienelactone hydrolase